MRATILTIVALLTTVPALAEPIVVLGHYTLQPNQPDQAIPIYVSSLPADAVEGMNLNVQVNQFGTGDLAAGGPAIRKVGSPSGLDVLTGTLFGSSALPPDDVDGPAAGDLWAQFEGVSFLADGPVVVPETPVLLATLWLDTTGLSSGQWELSLIHTLNAPTNFAGIIPQLTDGTLEIAGATVVPEPSSLWLFVGIGGIALLGVRWLRSSPPPGPA